MARALAAMLAILALWYGAWQGLMEPVLPRHLFRAHDWLDLGFGVVCAVAAFRLSLGDSAAPREERLRRLDNARLWLGVALSASLSFHFLFQALNAWDASVDPFATLAFHLTRHTALDISPENRNPLRHLGYLIWVVAMLTPLLISAVKVFVSVTIVLYGLTWAFRPEALRLRNEHPLELAPLRLIGLCHVLTPLGYLAFW